MYLNSEYCQIFINPIQIDPFDWAGPRPGTYLPTLPPVLAHSFGQNVSQLSDVLNSWNFRKVMTQNWVSVRKVSWQTLSFGSSHGESDTKLQGQWALCASKVEVSQKCSKKWIYSKKHPKKWIYSKKDSKKSNQSKKWTQESVSTQKSKLKKSSKNWVKP